MTKEEILNKLDTLIGEVMSGETELNKDCFDLLDMICLVHFCFFSNSSMENFLIKKNLPLLNMYYMILNAYELMDKGMDKQEAVKNVLSEISFNTLLQSVDKVILN
jgi:hypothetical protein